MGGGIGFDFGGAGGPRLTPGFLGLMCGGGGITFTAYFVSSTYSSSVLRIADSSPKVSTWKGTCDADL